MNMELSKQQSKAAKAISDWYQSNKQTFCLSGYAGTGKSTIVKELLGEFDSFDMIAPTGKAAFVLSSKTGLEVKTVHSLLYNPRQVIDYKFLELKEKLSLDPENERLQMLVRNYKSDCESVEFSAKGVKESSRHTIIIDEGSMIGKKLWNDLHATGAKLLFIGDTAQLPPVKDTPMFHKAEKGAVLTEVHRQAEGSDILRLATQIRNGGIIDIEDYQHGDARIVNASDVDVDPWLTCDKVITDTNASRFKLNKFIRAKLGMKGLVDKDELLICCANDWRHKPTPLINGVESRSIGVGSLVNDDGILIKMDYLGEQMQLLVNTHLFDKNYGSNRYVPWEDLDGMKQFDYGYALTVHKSQGSEWGNVMFADSSGVLNSSKADKRRLAYTAVTRASETFTWVTK